MIKLRVNFEDMLKAKKAAEALKQLGYTDAHLDAADPFQEEYAEELGAMSGLQSSRFTGNIATTGFGQQIHKSPRIPNGGSGEDYGSLSRARGGIHARLIVSIPEENSNEVLRFLDRSGAIFR